MRMTATLKEAILLLIICTADLILSAEFGTSPHNVVYACTGSPAHLQRKLIIDPATEVIQNVDWFFHSASSKEMVAYYFREKLVSKPKYDGRISQFPEYGVTLNNVTNGDAGSYSVEYVTTKSNVHNALVTKSYSMFLQVSDRLMVKRGHLEMTLDPVPVWNTTSRQWTIRLMCGFFTFQGEPPIQVEWIMPGGEIKNSSGYTGGHFYLSLLSPVVYAKNYTCRLPQQFYRKACFEPKMPGDGPLVTEATIVLDELRVKLVLANAEIKRLRQENKRLQYKLTRFAEVCGGLKYTVLDNAWRATTNSDIRSQHCDMDLPAGWYRFKMNDTDAQIPTSCATDGHCGTMHPVWLNLKNQSLPGVDQEVEAQACVTYKDNCCDSRLSWPVKVRKCLTFYFYYLLPPPGCWVAYCTTSN